ncbi:MAG: ferrous iron transporter B [Verrucomicrobia bacterium]|nr:ferrous iron transporter B [Verrucomicrobiota bacterium]MCH8514347.1 ferrous iron transporter B [Kiritimatiellia bacterium]
MNAPLPRVVLAGNPNAGKTTLFNALTGLRARTGNYHGTTVEKKSAILGLPQKVELIDLPGMYSLRAVTEDEKVAAQVLRGHDAKFPHPDVIIAVVDASNLDRNLFLVSQLAECGRPMIVALTMLDAAAGQGLALNTDLLSSRLGCPVVPVPYGSQEGADALKSLLGEWLDGGVGKVALPHRPREDLLCGAGCSGCPFHGRFTWSEQLAREVVRSHHVIKNRHTERLDEILTHPWLGVLAFLGVMVLLFSLIFSVAELPMELIEGLFSDVSAAATHRLPDNLFGSLVGNGILQGVGNVVVFLPQILILFFFLALLEDTGYLSRAAFVMDRLMKRVGLPGTAFVPMVSGHACAIPAIMSARVIENRRDRLATILVLPFMSCAARIPVYVILIRLLFPGRPFLAGLTFTGAYALGALAALGTAFVLKKTLLPGESKPLLLELPAYKTPNLRNAFLHAIQRGNLFLKQAGGIILLISIAIWALSTFPATPPPETAIALRAEAVHATPDEAEGLLETAKNLEAQHALEHSFAGRLGRGIEPVVRPLGYDWRIGIGVLSSFAAREVIVSTLSIVYGLGEDADESDQLLVDTLREVRNPDGSPVFTTATAWSLLVFYVLAMQCLPTQAVTRLETGSWKWAALQLGYMSALAYFCALVTYQGLRALGYA